MSFFHHFCLFFVCSFLLQTFVYVSEFCQDEKMKGEGQDAKKMQAPKGIVFLSQFLLGRTLQKIGN